MRMPMTARFRTLLSNSTIVVGGMFLGACANDATAPSPTAPHTAVGISSFKPGAATMALYGVVDGVYALTVNPALDQSFNIGSNYITFPANSICRLATSGYGLAFWNSDCAAETLPVAVTVTISGSNTANPRMDFQPAMRFNPDKQVNLYMYSPTLNVADTWKLLYCDALNVCVDESKTDSSLQTYVDPTAKVIFRRIKHFSGYLVSSDDATPPPVL